MKKLGLITLSLITAVCMAFSVLTFVWNTAYASTGNITTDSNEQPLDSLVENGGLTSIFDKIAVVGDSLSSGMLEQVTSVGNFQNQTMDYSWGQFMARTLGKPVYNLSQSGMTASAYCTYFAESNGFWDETYESDAYYIALGYNDLLVYGGQAGNVATDVNVSDYTQNATTFAGYMGQIISRYKLVNENAVFFLVTMPVDSSDTNRANIQSAHQTVLYDLADAFTNTYVIDLRAHGPAYDADFVENYYLGGHLNTSGYALTAKIITSYTDYIIRHNTDAFRNLGLTVPEDYTHTVVPVQYDLNEQALTVSSSMWGGIESEPGMFVGVWNESSTTFTPGVSHQIAVRFTAPADGTVSPDGNGTIAVSSLQHDPVATNSDGVRMALYHNNQKIYPTNSDWIEITTAGTTINCENSFSMKQGDTLTLVFDNGGNGDNGWDSATNGFGFFWSDTTYDTPFWFSSAANGWSNEEMGNQVVSGGTNLSTVVTTTYLKKDVISYVATSVEKVGILPVLGDQTELPLTKNAIDGGLAEIIRTAGLFTTESQTPAWVNEYSKITKTAISVASDNTSAQAYFIDSSILASAVPTMINGIKELNDVAYIFLIADSETQKSAFESIAFDTERVYLIDLYTYGEGTTDAQIAKDIANYVDYIIRQNMADFKTFGVPKVATPVEVTQTNDKLLEVGNLTYDAPSFTGGEKLWVGAPNEEVHYIAPAWNDTLCPGVNYALALGFTAPVDGTIYPTNGTTGLGAVAISNSGNGNGARFAIYLNQTKIFPVDSDWYDIQTLDANIPCDGLKIKQGDTLYFIADSNGDNNFDNIRMVMGFFWVDSVNNTSLTWYDSTLACGGWTTTESGNELNSLGYKKSETLSYHYVLVGDRYTVSYNLNGGEVATANPTEFSNTSADFTLNNPTKTGYTFIGWTGTGYTQPTTTATIAKGTTENKSFVANWQATEYAITYQLDGGTNGNNPATYTIEDAVTFENPTKLGYTFDGWTIDGLDTTGIALGTTGEITVTANWQATEYTITYVLDGGTNGNNPTTYTIEDAVTFENPTKSGYTFKGWKIDGQDATGIALGTTGNVTATATWEIIPTQNTPNNPSPNKGGCGSSASGGIAISLIAILGGVSLLIKKKKD